MTNFWSKAVQKIKSKVANESLPTISQETIDKTNPQPSTETPPFTTSTAAPTPAQEEVKQKINTGKDILVGFDRKRDLWQLTQSDRKEITSRKSTLRKYKADLKPEVLCVRGRGGGV